MTNITFRNYQGPADLQLQYGFWNSITRNLPWCWKPTLSPEIFLRETNYDPQTRWFAFDGDELIGYMSFSGKEDFVSLGYPWVKPGYEGQIQQELYNLVYGYASSSKYGGRTFAQRFRSDWTTQIDFFLAKKFTITHKVPIYVVDVLSMPMHTRKDSNGTYIKMTNSFDFEYYKMVAETTLDVEPGQLEMLQEYYASVDFDFAIQAQNDKSLGYFGVTIRSDTGFAEINAAPFDQHNIFVVDACITAITTYLETLNIKYLGISGSFIPDQSILHDMGFRHVCDEVMMVKTI